MYTDKPFAVNLGPAGRDGGYDCIVALQAVRHIVAPPVHYAAKLKLPVVTGEKDVGQMGGMVGLKVIS